MGQPGPVCWPNLQAQFWMTISGICMTMLRGDTDKTPAVFSARLA
jgi:hypothetical protein